MAMGRANSYLPRTLYGRAALILLVPVLALQLVVSVVFIQRHYDGVTVQMTRNVVRELALIADTINAAATSQQALADAATIAVPLAFELALPSLAPEHDKRAFYDLPARAMMRTMRETLPQAVRFDTTINRQVWVWLETDLGTLSAMFDRRRISASNPHQLLVLMIFAGLVLAGISIVFMRNQLRPIRRLARASEAFGKGQVIDYVPRGATEVRAAGKAFVAMRSRIERQIEQRTMMLSGVSHDLRTPLTRMKLGLAMLDDGPDVQAMLRDVEDMERLVEEFLAFARGDSLEDPESVDPAWLVLEAVDKQRALGADVALDIATETQVVTLHPMAVARALDNLIGNAVKYGGQAEVTLLQTDGSVSFTVEDPGPGIPAEQRDEALKPFARLDAARNQDRGSGVGLGLAIAHDIARRHGGRLELGQSERLGGLSATLVLVQ